MTGKYHFISAGLTGLTASVLYVLNGEFNLAGICEAGSLLVSASAAGLMPDVDLPKSTAGKALKPVSHWLNKAFGHRTITHSGLWLILLFILLQQTNQRPFLLGTSIGYFTHIFADTFTAGGIPWIYPLSKKRISFTKIMSGHHDLFLTLLASGFIISAFIIYYLYKNGLI